MKEEEGRERVHSHSEILHNKEIETETKLEEVGIIEPPDGGYGWVVVIASFFANAVVDGVIFSIGETILPIWEKEFKANTATVSIATSLLAGSYLLSGKLITHAFFKAPNIFFRPNC